MVDGFFWQLEKREELMSDRDKEKTNWVVKARHEMGKFNVQYLKNLAVTSCLA